MISVEVELPTISLAAFLCALCVVPGGVLGVLLSAGPTYVGDQSLRIVSGLVGALLLTTALAFGACGFLPQRRTPLLFLLLSASGSVASGIVWIAFRLGVVEISMAMACLRLEIACFATWAFGILVTTAYLSVAVTHISFISAVAKEPPSPASFEASPVSVCK
jgi:hypothetical protein